MKHLQDYIVEQAEVKVDEGVTSKSITFDFTDLENAEETLKSLEGKDGVSIDDKKLTLEITADNVDKIGTAQDLKIFFNNSVKQFVSHKKYLQMNNMPKRLLSLKKILER